MPDVPDSFASVLIAAIQVALRADADIAELVQRKVYDRVPGITGSPHVNVIPPWIFIGPLQGRRFEDNGYRAWQPRIRLFAASSTFGRAGPWQIIDAIDAALDRQTLNLGADFKMTRELAALESGDVVDPTKDPTAYADFDCVIYRGAPFVAGAL